MGLLGIVVCVGASTHNRAYWLQLFLHCTSLHDPTESPMCPFGKTLSKCYSQCAPECNMAPTEPGQCPACSSGCFCPSNLYQFGDFCLPKDSCPDIEFGRFISLSVTHSFTHSVTYIALSVSVYTSLCMYLPNTSHCYSSRCYPCGGQV